jgi:hypothetical protein
MESLSFINSIGFTGDNYVTVTINSNDRIDDYQFSIVNSSGNNLINCVKDRYEVNCLLYYIENFIPLKQLAMKNVFSLEDFQKLIEQISELVLWTRDKKLIMSNTILDLDYIFVDKYSYEVKLIYIPVMSNDHVAFATESFQDLIKKIVNISTVNNANEFIGLVLANINTQNFDVVNFKKNISSFNIENENVSNSNKRISGFIISVLIIGFCCICIPLIGNIAKISIVTNYINYQAIMCFSFLFIFGTLLALTFCLMGNKKEKKVNHMEQNCTNSYSYEFEKSEIGSEKLRENHKNEKYDSTISKNIEYNPLESEQFDLESRRVRKEDLKKIINKGTEVGTQILLDDAIERQAYIIKNGLNDRVNIDKSSFIIGRDKSISHFVIMKSSISKQHATISNIENKYYITDNGSSNGTYLNCIRLQPNKRYELNDKDNIIFADENYQFRLK